MAKRNSNKHLVFKQLESDFFSPNITSLSESDCIHHEIIYVSENVDGYEQIVASILIEEDEYTQVDIVVLHREWDGVEQISKSLDAYEHVDTIHVISRGIDGAVNLGNTWLNQDNLAEYTDTFHNWSNVLGADADLLFHGCNLAETDYGRKFVENLSRLMGLDVI